MVQTAVLVLVATATAARRLWEWLLAVARSCHGVCAQRWSGLLGSGSSKLGAGRRKTRSARRAASGVAARGELHVTSVAAGAVQPYGASMRGWNPGGVAADAGRRAAAVGAPEVASAGRLGLTRHAIALVLCCPLIFLLRPCAGTACLRSALHAELSRHRPRPAGRHATWAPSLLGDLPGCWGGRPSGCSGGARPCCFPFPGCGRGWG